MPADPSPPGIKRSTINSLLNERAATVAAFQQDSATKPTVYSRRAAGFTLHLIDAPSLLDQDNVSEAVRGAQPRGASEHASAHGAARGQPLARRIAGRPGTGPCGRGSREASRCWPSGAWGLALALARRCPRHAAPPAPTQKLEAIGKAVRERPVDAVLYLDRLDSYKVDTLDQKVGGWV